MNAADPAAGHAAEERGDAESFAGGAEELAAAEIMA